MEKPIFVTGSEKKLEEVNSILTAFSLENVELDLEEIQSEHIYKIAKDKAKRAYDILKKPVIIEDVGFYLDELDGFPGPLIKWFIIKLKDKGIYKLSKHFQNKNALTRCVVCYFNGKKFFLFTGDVKGKIIDPKNRKAFGFDSIFRPNGLKKSYATLTSEEKNSISHRALAWKKFEKFFANSI